MAPPVTHIVLLQFKDGISPTEIKKTTASFLALKHECKHPVTHTNYITSISGGLDNSKEGLQSSLTHAFILTFPTLMDRDFYVAKDPAHSLFKSSLKDLVEKVVVVDYVDGVFVPMEEGKEEKKD